LNLNEFVSGHRKLAHEALLAGREPAGEFDAQVLREARTKGKPQVGATRYEVDAVILEFIYPDPTGAAAILDVRIPAPDQIVFLPVPPWVIEQIWQGEVTGSHHFAAQAREMLDRLYALIAPKS
jgi:hypothetical protein